MLSESVSNSIFMNTYDKSQITRKSLPLKGKTCIPLLTASAAVLLPLLIAHFFCHRQRWQTYPLPYETVIT